MAYFNKSRGGGHSNQGGDRKFGKRNFEKRGFGGRSSDRPMYKATCTECGNPCEVPFKPTGDRPVFCNNCFRKDGDNTSERSSRRPQKDYGERSFNRNSEWSPMHQAVCDECGDSCEVPFKPTGEKPVFCNNCFKKSGGGGNKNMDRFQEKLDILDIKLDRVLKALSLLTVKPSESSEEKAPSTKASTKPKKMKTTKKAK